MNNSITDLIKKDEMFKTYKDKINKAAFKTNLLDQPKANHSYKEDTKWTSDDDKTFAKMHDVLKVLEKRIHIDQAQEFEKLNNVIAVYS